jgi:hypothetical protein
MSNRALSPAPRAPRFFRQALPWLLALSVATCTADQGGPTTTGVGYFSFKPVYQLAGGASLSQFGILADTVRVRITRPLDQLVLDTAVAFPADSTSLRLALPVILETSPEQLDAVITISAQGVVIFLDSVQVQVQDGPPGSTTPPTVVFEYVGPGTNIGTLDITPGDTTIVLGDTLVFTAAAFDSSAAPVATFYVAWKSTDTLLAKVNAGGRLIAPNLRGTVDVIATTPTGISDTTTVIFAPVPVIIRADSGGAQSGLVGDSLASLLVARVKGADSLGISGIGVRFTAVTAGGAVRDTVVLTDANGRARTRVLLGTAAGAYTYTASVIGTGLTPATFLATATPTAAAAIAILSGNAQIDTIGKLLPLPLTVEIRDAFNNVVPGATVVFTRPFGLGILADDSVVTNGSGTASAGYTLAATIGTDTVRATIAGTSAFVNFTATAISATPAAILGDSGDLQSAAVLLGFADSLVVRVLDAGANPVPGVTVQWIEESGSVALSATTSLTGVDGRARIGVTAGAVAEAVPVLATVAGLADTATFTLNVLPGAPASLTIVTGNGQSGAAGTILGIAPTVQIRDAQNNLVPGVDVDFAVTAGAGTIDSATSTTDANGQANAGVWTLGALTGLNQVRATSAAVPADTLLFDATATPAGTSKLWTAAVNNVWNLAGNWSPSGVPTTLDNVFVAASVTSPVVSVTTGIQDLSIESGATVTLGAITFNVSGNADIGGLLTGTGTLNLTGTAKTLRGTTSTALILVNGTPTLDGATSVTGPLTVNAGTLTIGGQALAVSGALTVQGSGQLVMTNTADSVDVGGTLAYTTSTSGFGSLTSGILVARGIVTQTAGALDNLAASGTHALRLAGAGGQTVSFSSPGASSSRLLNVEFADPAGVTLASNLTVLGSTTVSAGTVTGLTRTATLFGGLASPYAAWQVSATQFSASPAVYPDSLPRHVTVFGPWTLNKPFKTDSNLIVSSGGTLTLNGNALRVGGAFTNTGRLSMSNAGDSLDVAGTFTVNSALSGVADLSDGVIVFHGDFVQQAGASNNFQPSGTHRARFLGSAAQSVSFTNFGASTSRFAEVEFGNAAGITLNSNVHVAGATTVSAGAVTGIGRTATLAGNLASAYAAWQVSTTSLIGIPTVYPDSFPRNVVLGNILNLSKPFAVDSAFTITPAGAFVLGGHPMRVGGAFTQTGGLYMQDVADTLTVEGLLTVNSGLSSSGQLTDGLLVLRGGFSQQAGASDNFAPGGGHTTAFVGTGGQSVGFANPNASASRFQGLVVDDSLTLTSDLAVAGGVAIAPTGRVTGPARTATLYGQLADPSLLGWRVAVTVLGGKYQTVPSALVTDLVLQDTFLIAQPTTVTGNLTIQGPSYMALTGHALSVSGDLVQSGELGMLASGDSLDVGGDFLVNSGQSGAGDLLAGVIVLRGGFSQQSGASDNFVGASPHRVRFTGAIGGSVGFTNPASSMFGDLDIDATGALTLTSDIRALGTFKVAGGPSTLTSPSNQRLLRTSALAVDGLTLNRVRVQLNSPASNAAQFDNVTFANIDPTLTQLSLEFPGQTGDTIKFDNVAFSGTPTTGRYVFVADSIANDAPANIGFYNSTPLNGALFAGTEGTIGDVATILWTHLDWITQPANGIELFPIFAAPQVGAFDPSGVLVSSYTGTVTLSFLSNPVGALLGGNSVAAVGGIATFDALTVSLAGIGYQLQATSAELGLNPGSSTFDITVPLPVGTTTAFNNGGGDNDWFNPANWTAGIPDSSDNVYVFPSVTANIDLPARANRVEIGTGGAIILNAVLAVDSSVTAGNTISGGAQLVAQGSGELSGQVGDLMILGDYSVAPGGSLAALNLVVSGGSLDLNGRRVDVAGDFSTSGGGQFTMSTAADTLIVGGNVNVAGGSTDGLLVDGLLEIGGSFNQSPDGSFASFRAGGSHLTRFTGGTGVERVIAFGTPVEASDPFSTNNSRFGHLELTNGIDSLASTIPVDGDFLVVTAAVLNMVGGTGGPAVTGNVLVQAASPQFAAEDLSVGGVLDFQPSADVYQVGTTLFFGTGQSIPALPYQDIEVAMGQATLTSDLSVGNVRTGVSSEGPGFPGDLRLGGHKLTVGGNFTTTGQGSFTMDDPADSLDVTGQTDLGGGVTTALTAGTMVVRGDLYMQDSNFVASGTHKTVFAAPGGQQLWIMTSPAPGNQFNRVTVLAGTTVNFNAFSVGPMLVADTFWVNGFFVQANPGKTIIARGDLYAGVAAGITVDTVEVHDELEIDASGYSTQLTRYAGIGQVIASNVSYNDVEVTGTAALAASTNIGRDLRVTKSGQLTIGAFGLGVTGSFRTLDSGTVVMTDPASSIYADTAEFAGGSTAGLLTAGALQARTLIQANPTSDLSYFASGAHVTQIGTTMGGPEYRIQMATGDLSRSRIRHLLLADGGVGSVPTRIVGRVTVTGKLLTVSEGSGGIIGDPGSFLSVTDSLVVQDPATDIAIDTLELYGGIQIPNNTLASGVVRFMIAGQVIPDSQTYAGIEVWGNVGVEPAVIAQQIRVLNNGRLTIAGGQGVVASVVRTEQLGTLEMAGPTAQLQVNDTLVMAGGSTAGLLRQGFLTLNGDLIQDGTNSPASFAVDSQMYTFFTNPAGQFVTMATPGNAGSHFGFVNLQPNTVLSINASGPVPIWGEMSVQSGANLNSNAALDVAQNMVSGTASMVTAPLFIFRTGSAPDPSTTWNVGRTAFAGADTLNIPQLTYNGDVEVWTMGRIVYPLSIAGAFRVGGAGTPAYASWSNATVTAGNLDVIDNSRFGMSSAADSLLILGSAHFDGGYLADQLIGGTILLDGDLVQDSTWTTQSFGLGGTSLEFALGPTHRLVFASPDDSPFQQISSGAAGTLALQMVGRVVVQGDISGYGIDLSGDSLWIGGQIAAGPGGAQVTVAELRVGTLDQFTNFTNFNAGTVHFLGDGNLPFTDLTFDSLFVHGGVGGQLSQLLTANYAEVTADGNPRHLGGGTGALTLAGGDGNTTLKVSGDVLVRGPGAHISSFEGNLDADGDLTVDQDGYLYSTGSFGGASWSVGGDVLMAGTTTKDSLVRGHLKIGGNFTQLGTSSGSSFAPDSTFLTEFTGAGPHLVSFETPGDNTVAGFSYFGSLATGDSVMTIQMDGDYYVEGILSTAGTGNNTTFQNIGATLGRITARDVNLQNVTFDHLQFRLEKHSAPASGTGNIDIVNFTNFQNDENQFVVTLPGLGAGNFVWANFTFTGLAASGLDTGRYIVATDWDGPTPNILTILIGTNQSGDPATYFLGLNGAVVTPFTP